METPLTNRQEFVRNMVANAVGGIISGVIVATLLYFISRQFKRQ